MKVIYIAGHYRDERGEWYVRRNIRRAEEEAVFVWTIGGVALCPHKNTAGFGGVNGLPDDTWLNGDFELLKRCDAVYMVGDWITSHGALDEMAYAAENHIPILKGRKEVANFLGYEGKHE